MTPTPTPPVVTGVPETATGAGEAITYSVGADFFGDHFLDHFGTSTFFAAADTTQVYVTADRHHIQINNTEERGIALTVSCMT